jgi:hypothetical protein
MQLINAKIIGYGDLRNRVAWRSDEGDPDSCRRLKHDQAAIEALQPAAIKISQIGSKRSASNKPSGIYQTRQRGAGLPPYFFFQCMERIRRAESPFE